MNAFSIATTHSEGVPSADARVSDKGEVSVWLRCGNCSVSFDIEAAESAAAAMQAAIAGAKEMRAAYEQALVVIVADEATP